jgi:hypothetical protein
MKVNKSKSKYNILQKIQSRQISQQERMHIKSDFLNHLNSPWGTLENYQKKALVKSLMEHYPGTLDPQTVAEYTQYKVNAFMGRIYELATNNKKIYANPLILKMILNHLKGIDETPHNPLNQQIVIQNWFPTSNAGQPTLPEPKTEIDSIDK